MVRSEYSGLLNNSWSSAFDFMAGVPLGTAGEGLSQVFGAAKW
jgi:hypothetical protein